MAYEKEGEYRSSDRSVVGTAFTFLLIGLGVGSLVTLLLAPRSGKQMRRMIRRGYQDARNTIGERAEEFAERSSELMEAARETVEAAREKMDAAREKVRPLARRI